MMDFAKKIFRGDRVIWMIFLFLCLISIIAVYSASSLLTFRTHYWMPILKHTMFLLMGTVIVLLIHSLNPKFFWVFVVMLPFVWLLLIATQFLGKTVHEAQRYLFGFQPSEVAKLCLIACVAFILSRQKSKISEGVSFKWIWAITIITCILILRDNFSTAALLYAVIGVMMFIGQVSFKRMSVFFLVTFTFVAMLFIYIWFLPETAQKTGLRRGVTWVERIKEYKGKQDVRDEGFRITDDNYQSAHAKIAVARGKLFGKMPGNGQQRDFLPQAYSDFIYAIIIEETGIIGGVFILFLYVFLFIRAGTIASRCPKLFPKLLVMGCAVMLVMQALVNMSVSEIGRAHV
jgi:cell division protein FtsW